MTGDGVNMRAGPAQHAEPKCKDKKVNLIKQTNGRPKREVSRSEALLRSAMRAETAIQDEEGLAHDE